MGLDVVNINTPIYDMLLSEVVIDVNNIKECHLWRNIVSNNDMEIMMML